MIDISTQETMVTIVDNDTLGVVGATVTSTTSTSTAGYYGANDTIEFTVTFNGAVTVTGTPQFTFELGGQTRQAWYLSKTPSGELVFTSTIYSGDDHDGISWVANSLGLNGGTIKFTHTDPAKQVNADLSHPAQGALPSQKVDTTKPSLALGVGATLTMTFTEALNTAAPATSAFTVRVGGGTGTNPTAVTVSGRVVTLTMAADFTGGHTTVTYTKPSTNPLRDLSGKEADALTNRTIRTAPPLPVGVVFESHLFTVKEGETVSVAVWLNRDPERTFTIPIWKTYDGVGVNDFNFPDGVTFNSGEIFKALTFTATEDQLDENGQQMGLRFGTPPPGVTPGFPRQSAVYIIDEDGAGVSVSTSTISVARGESEMYTLVLATLPTGDVTVTPLSREGHVTFSPPAITFTPNDWDMPKRVTVRASATAGGIDTIAHTVSCYGGVGAVHAARHGDVRRRRLWRRRKLRRGSRHADGDPHSDALADSDCGAFSHADADRDDNAAAHNDTNRHANADRDAHAATDRHAGAHATAGCHAAADPDARADRNGDATAHGDAAAHRYASAHCHCHTHAAAHADIAAYADAAAYTAAYAYTATTAAAHGHGDCNSHAAGRRRSRAAVAVAVAAAGAAGRSGCRGRLRLLRARTPRPLAAATPSPRRKTLDDV